MLLKWLLLLLLKWLLLKWLLKWLLLKWLLKWLLLKWLLRSTKTLPHHHDWPARWARLRHHALR